MNEKIKYWWSEDRQFFCIRIKGETVSLTIEEAEALMGEVMQTPSFLKLQEEAWRQALRLMDASRDASPELAEGEASGQVGDRTGAEASDRAR